jgi:putative membrane protein
VPDPGLQPERTALAWRRTALALLVGPVVAARLLVPDVGEVAAIALVAGCGLGLGIALVAARRDRSAVRALSGRADPGARPGAGLLAVTAAVPVVGGILAAAVLLDHLGR